MSDFHSLTPRELEILASLSEGLSDKEIASRLFLTVGTIKWYNREIYSKLNVKNRKDAARRAIDLGLLDHGTSRSPPKHNLPVELTPFIGREAELTDLTERLSEYRLVTILAPGGMGKTRLALRAASAQRFDDGVYYVPLAPLRTSEFSDLTTADFIISTIAGVLNLPSVAGSDPKQQLLDYFLEKNSLLVMDNCEHLLEGISVLSEILSYAPHIKILATSRERLNLSGEVILTLKGMDVPEDGDSDIVDYESIQLFVQTAQRSHADFALHAENTEYARRICQIVQGMPLGIELAAGWIQTLTAEEIASEIMNDLDFLATDLRDVPPRLRSIRTIFEYSWQRLTRYERQALMKLSVFPGKFTREAAQSATGATAQTLNGLVSKSLLWRRPDNHYEIHELLRQYSEEYLEASGEMTAACDAHALYYLDFLSEREADVKGKRQLAALDEIENAFENIRAAWDWALTREFYDVLSQTPESLLWFCSMRGYLQAGVDLFLRAETQIDSVAHEAIWGRLVARGTRLRVMMKDYDNVLETLQACLSIAQAHESQTDVAFCLMMAGNTYWHIHDYGTGIQYYEQSLEYYRQIDDLFYVSLLKFFLAFIYDFVGRPVDMCLDFARQSYELMRETGNLSWIMWPLETLGRLTLRLGDVASAEQHFREGYDVCRNFNNRIGIAWMGYYLSLSPFWGDHLDDARQFAQEALGIGTDLNHPGSTSLALLSLGYIELVEERYTKSQQLLEDSLPLAEYRLWISDIYQGLCASACALGDFMTARNQLSAALEYLDKSQQYVMNLTPKLVLRAIITAHENETERAAELFGCVHAHDTPSWLQRWDLLTRLYADLEANLGSKVYNAAWERGQKLDLETVWADLQAEVTGWK